MALPVTISSVEIPDQNNYCAPFLSGGAVYVVLLDSADNSILEVHKATDPTSSFTEQDSANKPDLTNNALSVWVYQDGTDLHVGHQEFPTGRVAYSVFHMATDLWDGTILDELIEAPTDAPEQLNVSCSIALRSDGDVIVLYNGGRDQIHGTRYNRVDYGRREGGSWGGNVGIAVDNAGEDHWHGSVIVRGSSDRMHFFFSNTDLNDGYQRTLTSGNALETFPSAGDTDTDTIRHIFASGTSYDDSGTQRVRCPYRGSSLKVSYAEFDSADAPGAFTVNADVSADAVDIEGGTPVTCLSSDGIDEHLLYVHSISFDLFHDKNDSSNLRLIDGEVRDVFCNIYTRGIARLAYVYVDSGTLKYNELDLGLAFTRTPYRQRTIPGRGGDFREGTLGAMGISR